MPTQPGSSDTSPPSLRTERLLLRPWRESDLAAFADLNADPRVTEMLGGPADRATSDALAARIVEGFAKRGFGLWAMEVPRLAPFIGFVGLSVPNFDAPFMPAVEIGWRLAFDHWGKGYATEGARVALDFGFTRAGLPEIVAFTAKINVKSRAVMQRLGMHHDATDDFTHPKLPADHLLHHHVLYRLTGAEWQRRHS